MDTILTPTAAEIKPDNLNEYQRRALATRKRRQAAGKYKRPTARQQRAFAKYLSAQSLTQQEYSALSTHPYLLERQREKFATLAAELEADDYADDIADRDDWQRGGW